MVESRDKIDAFCLELLDIIIRKLHRVFNRVYTRGQAVAETFSSKRVTRNFVTLVVRLVYERLNFFQGERGRYNQRTIWRKRKIIIGIKLDPVCAVYELLTDAFARIPWVVDGFQHRGQRNIT